MIQKIRRIRARMEVRFIFEPGLGDHLLRLVGEGIPHVEGRQLLLQGETRIGTAGREAILVLPGSTRTRRHHPLLHHPVLQDVTGTTTTDVVIEGVISEDHHLRYRGHLLHHLHLPGMATTTVAATTKIVRLPHLIAIKTDTEHHLVKTLLLHLVEGNAHPREEKKGIHIIPEVVEDLLQGDLFRHCLPHHLGTGDGGVPLGLSRLQDETGIETGMGTGI